MAPYEIHTLWSYKEFQSRYPCNMENRRLHSEFNWPLTGARFLQILLDSFQILLTGYKLIVDCEWFSLKSLWLADSVDFVGFLQIRWDSGIPILEGFSKTELNCRLELSFSFFQLPAKDLKTGGRTIRQAW
jgi:hypothetical protein